MKITSAKFVKGLTGDDPILGSTLPQIAFIGRSNVGKSSLINSLTKVKDLARTSSFPGRTQEINLFLINQSFFLVDLPGYGFALGSGAGREKIRELIDSYLFRSYYVQKKVVLIIDAKVGVTKNDLGMLAALEQHGKDIAVVANKIDKIKKSEYKKQLTEIQEMVGHHTVIPYSSKEKIGIGAVINEIFG